MHHYTQPLYRMQCMKAESTTVFIPYITHINLWNDVSINTYSSTILPSLGLIALHIGVNPSYPCMAIHS